MPELLSQITRDETARRQRAADFERLSNRRDLLRNTIARLETPVDASVLAQIADLVPSIPEGLITRGFGGGHDVRDKLRLTVAHALEDLGFKEERRVAELAVAQRDLANVETALAAFN